jgi:hypothetical protein
MNAACGCGADLIPPEASAADHVLHYAETTFAAMAHLNSNTLRQVNICCTGERLQNQVRSVAWQAVERGELCRKAKAAGNEIELKPCDR